MSEAHKGGELRSTAELAAELRGLRLRFSEVDLDFAAADREGAATIRARITAVEDALWERGVDPDEEV